MSRNLNPLRRRFPRLRLPRLPWALDFGTFELELCDEDVLPALGEPLAGVSREGSS